MCILHLVAFIIFVHEIISIKKWTLIFLIISKFLNIFFLFLFLAIVDLLIFFSFPGSFDLAGCQVLVVAKSLCVSCQQQLLDPSRSAVGRQDVARGSQATLGRVAGGPRGQQSCSIYGLKIFWTKNSNIYYYSSLHGDHFVVYIVI